MTTKEKIEDLFQSPDVINYIDFIKDKILSVKANNAEKRVADFLQSKYNWKWLNPNKHTNSPGIDLLFEEALAEVKNMNPCGRDGRAYGATQCDAILKDIEKLLKEDSERYKILCLAQYENSQDAFRILIKSNIRPMRLLREAYPALSFNYLSDNEPIFTKDTINILFF